MISFLGLRTEQTDAFHSSFGGGPVPGLFVTDYDAVAARLTDRVDWLTELQAAQGRQWRHHRAPDGNVYELMGPVSGCRDRP